MSDKKRVTIQDVEWLQLRHDALQQSKEPRLVLDTPFGRLIVTEG